MSVKGFKAAAARFVAAVGLVCGLLTLTAPDVQAASWMDPYLDQMVSWGIMRGDINGNLEPERNITRAEFVSMVNRAYGYTEVGPNPYQDVVTTDWFYEDICIARNVGYFSGMSNTVAAPRDPLTREQAAMLIGKNMMLQGGTGETLGFNDSRQFSDWSRHMIEAVAKEGVISGYTDGSFRPQQNVTRGEVAVMLSKAIGTPVQQSGVHSLGGVYGNLTINTPGVTLKDTVVYGDLYVSGGIGLSNVELENVRVLGKIVVSGTGESEKGEHSVLLRNVTADELVLDSMSNQFVTLKSEGFTNIAQVNVRTSAYLEDVTDNGYGLTGLTLDGAFGTKFHLAGNIKDVVNLTPGSTVTLAQGVTQSITIDEKAIGSTLDINNKAMAGVVNLDTATKVEGTGDIGHMNVNAAGSSSVMLPDTITVRPGITADIYEEEMDSVAAQESSEDPRLLSGYPAAENVSPKAADLVFKTNKKGTIYWAVTALADGTVEEDELMNPPVYGGTILKSGTLTATGSNTAFTAKVSGLTTDGSYYVSAILVDNRGMRSPVKITAFTTPDDTTPAFASGYPTVTIADGNDGEQIVQALVMPNKNCRMYYALLPKGSTAPKAADFKANAVTGNLGYGIVDVQKNTPYLVSKVNTVHLEEVTDYDLYLWLTDVDGAKSSAVKKVTVKTLDRTAPHIQHLTLKDVKATSVTLDFALNEPGTFYWAVVKDGEKFLLDGTYEVNNETKMAQIEAGINALKKGSSNASKASTDVKFTISGLQAQTAYDVYFVAKDKAGNYCVYRDSLKPPITVHTLDTMPPTVIQEFSHDGSSDPANLAPYPDSTIRLVFSENVQGIFDYDLDGTDNVTEFLTFYQDCVSEQKMDEFGETISQYITLYKENSTDPVPARDKNNEKGEWVVDYRKVKVEMDSSGTGELIISFPYNKDSGRSALNLAGGETYYFKLRGIADTSNKANKMVGIRGETNLQEFTVISAQVMFTETYDTVPKDHDGKKDDGSEDKSEEKWNFDMIFSAKPISHESMADDALWDMIVWSDSSVKFKVYMKEKDADGKWGAWKQVGSTEAAITTTDGKMLGVSLGTELLNYGFTPIKDMRERMYSIEITALSTGSDRTNWNMPVNLRVTAVSGQLNALQQAGDNLASSLDYDTVIAGNARVSDITVPLVFTLGKTFVDSSAPEFAKGFPSIVAGDTNVNIRVATTRPNSTYYYVIAPVGDIVTTIGSRNVTWDELPQGWEEDDNQNVKQVLVDTPTSDTIMNYKSLGADDPIKSGKGKYISSVPVIKVDGLEPKKQYIAYFVLQGEAQASFSKVYCFGFETGDVDTPIITLSDYSPQVSVKTSTDAEVDWILMESSKAMSHNVLKQTFYELIGPNENDQGKIADKQASFAKDENFKLMFPATKFPGKTSASVTVLDALVASMPDEDNDGVSMSVFDYYANAAIYQEVLEFVLNSQSGVNNASQGNLETVAQKGSYVSPDGMSPAISYHFIAVAHNTMGTTYGFSAIGNIHAANAQPPELKSCSTMIDEFYNRKGDKVTEPDDIDALYKMPVGCSFSGTVTLTFDKELHIAREGQAPTPLTKLKKADWDIYLGRPGVESATVTVKGYSIIIEFTKARYDSLMTFFNGGVISDAYGTNHNGQLLQLRMSTVTNDTTQMTTIEFVPSWAENPLKPTT